MFHVKHRRRERGRALREPETIAREVRATVGDSVAKLAMLRPGFVDRIQILAAALATWGARMNLTAEPEEPSEMAFHIIDSLAPLILASRDDGAFLLDTFSAGKRALDLGSGAGFPGLVLAAASEAHFTLAESRRKRASFLTVTASEMGLHSVTVEAAHVRDSQVEPVCPIKPVLEPAFDVVTARAFGDPASVYRLAAAALKPGGFAILYANPSQRLQLDEAGASGLGEYRRLAYEVERGDSSANRILAVWRRV
jgi:16S rRNA (guanine527-N7)-methyltransferase